MTTATPDTGFAQVATWLAGSTRVVALTGAGSDPGRVIELHGTIYQVHWCAGFPGAGAAPNPRRHRPRHHPYADSGSGRGVVPLI